MEILAETIMWLFILDQVLLVHYYLIVYKWMSPTHSSFFIGLVILAVLISIGLFDGAYLITVNTIYLGLVYNVVFNLKLNFLRMKPLLYLGEDSDLEEDSVIDRVERSMKAPGATLGLKIVMIISCLFILLQL